MRFLIEELKHPMVLLGYCGQAMFFSRFLLQWIVSERKGKSVVPVGFWYLSLLGGAILLMYALWRRDQVIAVGQIVGLFVYTRNLMLIRRQAAAPSAE